MLIVDSHEDLANNMLTFGRDYTLSARETRRREVGTLAPIVNDDALLGWPDYQRGRVAVVFATLFAAPVRRREGEWDILCYADVNQAARLYQAQVDAYERLVGEHPDKFRLILRQTDLETLLDCWKQLPPDPPDSTKAVEPPTASPGCQVGLVELMEGAECIRDPGDLEAWWLHGVRFIGPAWAGTRFCGGTHEPGPLTPQGYALLERMAEFGFCLDLSHMDEEAALQALDFYPAEIVATHGNALALLKETDSNRHLSDRVIQGILERDGVVGIVPYNAFLKVGWKRGDRRDEVSLSQVVAHIDYICQMAGDARHVGIGSDFEGGFGLQSVPPELDTIADLHKLVPLLQEKGYTETDIAAILGENWLARLRRVLPENA
jgi:membrane dipeptidase